MRASDVVLALSLAIEVLRIERDLRPGRTAYKVLNGLAAVV
jgi:hypothetical protein